jgi:hypothetical protein
MIKLPGPEPAEDGTGRVLHPRHGPHQAHAGTPARRPGSIRRTTTHTSTRPDGLVGDVHVAASGRDLWTAPDGAVSLVGRASMSAVIDFVGDRHLRSLLADPWFPGAASLVGLRVSSGFRKSLDDAWSTDEAAGSLTYQLLDELPVALLVSGFALGAAGLHPPRGSLTITDNADICAGWATGATILTEGEALGYPPVVTGPVAPPLLEPDDPDAWHELSGLEPHAMRRWRRIDLWPDGDTLAVDCFFRDSHMDDRGLETVVHEYRIEAVLDSTTQTFSSSRAHIGALPFIECPLAAPSAGRLVGTPALDLRERVRATFTGPTTCTHLNDTFRSMAAVPALAGAMRSRLH